MTIALDTGPEPALIQDDAAIQRERRGIVEALRAIGEPYLPVLWPNGNKDFVLPDDPRDPDQWDRFWATLMVADEHPEFLRDSWDGLDPRVIDRAREVGVRRVLCAGNGPVTEPRLLALAGFEVTALDLSPLAIRFAQARPCRGDLGRYLDEHGCAEMIARTIRRGGSVRWVAGDFMNPAVLPGPFDMVFTRRATVPGRALPGRRARSRGPGAPGWALFRAHPQHAASRDGAPRSGVLARFHPALRSTPVKPDRAARLDCSYPVELRLMYAAGNESISLKSSPKACASR